MGRHGCGEPHTPHSARRSRDRTSRVRWLLLPAGLGRASRENPGAHRRALKSLIGLLVVVAVGWIPVRALLETSSTEAVINARLITLRAPIEGQVGRPRGRRGRKPGPVRRRARQRRQSARRPGRLDDLRRLSTSSTATSRHWSRGAPISSPCTRTLPIRPAHSGRHASISSQARIAELGSDTVAAEARREEARQALARARSLYETGSGDAGLPG